MSFSIIVAVGKKQEMGYNGKLPFYLPNDLKWFKKNTIGHTVIMGRKTYESLPNGALKNRKNIVLSKSIRHLPDAIVINNFNDIFKITKDNEENFVIGGAQIYKLFLPYTTKIYMTKIHANFEADTFFPKIDWSKWELIEQIDNEPDEKNLYRHTFLIYKLKK